MTPLGRYIRERLHRRIFVWFGITILLTGAVASTIVTLATHGRLAYWIGDQDRAERFLSDEIANVWNAPAERNRLARSLTQNFGVPVEIVDVSGATVVATGGGCRGGPLWKIPIMREGTRLGTARLCGVISMSRTVYVAKVVLGMCVMGFLLWAASGAIAWHLAYPIEQVARAAEDIGAGKLSTRVKLPRERHMRRHHGEVAVLATALNTMAERIERQFQDQRELLAGVSHEIKTPLARIRLLLALARENGIDDPTLAEIDREVVEMDALVGELLASSRLDFATMTRSNLDAVEVAKRALERAGLSTAVLRVEAAETRFEADATLVARALANLIQNANRHGGGLTTLRVASRGDDVDGVRVVFEAEDCGPGIPPGEEDRVFDPFFRGTSATSTRDGLEEPRHLSLGLGLSLVRRIAEAHGGRAYAMQRPGGGACVGIELPAARSAEAPKQVFGVVSPA